MENTAKGSFPRWIFGLIAVGALLASEVYIGIMSIEGLTNMRMVQGIAFGLLGLIMFWGATH